MSLKNIFISIVSIFLISQVSFAQTADVPTGSGTDIDPYQIATLNNLYWLSTTQAAWASGTYFIQTANIDASATSDPSWPGGEGFSPIGTSFSNQFNGNYDGQDFIISNLYVNKSAYGGGLFGVVYNGTLENINLENVNISSTGTVGALGGELGNCTVTNCSSSGTITSTSNNAGGLIGTSAMTNGNLTIVGCSSSCDVIGKNFSGGLIGYFSGGSSATECTATGNITATGERVGGFIGEAQTNTSISCCSAEGDLVVTGRTVGGFVGHMWNSETISSCFATGNVTVTGSQSGGFVGHFGGSSNSINNCYSKGNVTTSSTATSDLRMTGAFVGSAMATNCNIQNCYSLGSVVFSNATNPTDKGFLGEEYAGITNPDNKFFNTETSNQLTSPNAATPSTTTAMTMQSTYENAGWDFNTTWAIDANNNDGYPYLQCAYEPVPISDWAIYLGIILMMTFFAFRFRKMLS